MVTTVARRGRFIASACGAVALLGATAPKPVPSTAEKPALIAERPTESGVFSANVLPAWRKFPLVLGHTRPIAATGCNGCYVPVSIVAVQGAKLIDADRPPRQTQLLVWINNLSDYATAATASLPSFLPSTEATYAKIADKDPITGRTRWQILEFRTGAEEAVRVVAAGVLRVCHRYTPDPARQSEADFKVCGPQIENGTVTGGAADQNLLTDSTKRPQPKPRPPGDWIECSNGCCT